MGHTALLKREGITTGQLTLQKAEDLCSLALVLLGVGRVSAAGTALRSLREGRGCMVGVCQVEEKACR